MSACDSWKQYVPGPTPIPPANLTAECPELPAASVADLGDLLGVCMDDAAMYRECRERHNALSRWARREE